MTLVQQSKKEKVVNNLSKLIAVANIDKEDINAMEEIELESILRSLTLNGIIDEDTYKKCFNVMQA